MASSIRLDAARPGRRMRSPKHTFSLRTRPFTIQPFMLAPVLPGETMENLLLQARVVSDPIKNRLIGWWHEYYIFYVKHRDLTDRDDFTDMHLDADKDMSSFNAAASVPTYHAASSIDWAMRCLERVVEEFFRNEGETWNTSPYSMDSMPLASVVGETFANSALLDDNFVLTDLNVDLDANATITAGEVDRALRTWELLKFNNLTDQSFEDYLRTFGVKVPGAEDSHQPELIRYVREWTYPSNTVEPTTGVPTSAVSWSISERADKKRFIREPGFIFGVTLTRPKMYFKNYDGSAADIMNSALRWLPAIMRDDPMTSLVKLTATEPPLGGIVADAGGYWFDIKDLLLYGDQFRNYANTVTNMNIADIPNAGLTNKRYPATADIDALFLSASPSNKVEQDGVVQLAIMGAQIDTTPISRLSSHTV